MSTIESSKVQITLQDESGNNQSFQIDNANTDTTLASIKMKLAPAIATNSWCSNYSIPFIRVKSGTIIETTKTKLQDGSTSIAIEPNPATIQTTEDTGNQIFQVTGMTIQGYNFQYLNGEQTITPNFTNTKINANANTVTATFNTPNVGTAYYNFIITDGTYTVAVPVTIERS